MKAILGSQEVSGENHQESVNVNDVDFGLIWDLDILGEKPSPVLNALDKQDREEFISVLTSLNKDEWNAFVFYWKSRAGSTNYKKMKKYSDLKKVRMATFGKFINWNYIKVNNDIKEISFNAKKTDWTTWNFSLSFENKKVRKFLNTKKYLELRKEYSDLVWSSRIWPNDINTINKQQNKKKVKQQERLNTLKKELDRMSWNMWNASEKKQSIYDRKMSEYKKLKETINNRPIYVEVLVDEIEWLYFEIDKLKNKKNRTKEENKILEQKKWKRNALEKQLKWLIVWHLYKVHLSRLKWLQLRTDHDVYLSKNDFYKTVATSISVRKKLLSWEYRVEYPIK